MTVAVWNIVESFSFSERYLHFTGVRTEALNLLIEQMDEAGDNMLLRHGTIRKSYNDGAEM